MKFRFPALGLCTLRHVTRPYVLLIGLVFFIAGCEKDRRDYLQVSSDKPVLHILEDAEFAITERNFRINVRLHIGKAIRERGSTGFPDNEVILFCNLSYAKRMLELAPEYVRFCPQRLSVYDKGEERIIFASLYPEDSSNIALNKVTREVNTEVREIVEFAATDWPELERSEQIDIAE